MCTLKIEYRHVPVMLQEVVYYLAEDNKRSTCNNYNMQGKIFLDCTLGGAGHSLQIAKYLGKDGCLIGIDQDREALYHAKKQLNSMNKDAIPEISLVNDNFGNLDRILVKQEIPWVDAILLDLGMSSYQIDSTDRGFSFKENCNLDMRMNPDKQKIDAKQILNTYTKDKLQKIIRNYSDEKFYKEISKAIVNYRQKKPIENSDELVKIIKSVIPAPARRQGGHPAKRVFQALRIEVNDELRVLNKALEAAARWLNKDGRIAVLSYHSLEDKIVKDFFNQMSNRCTCPPDFPKCVCNKKPIFKVISKKAIVASKKEVEQNSRSRSAKLRIAEKL